MYASFAVGLFFAALVGMAAAVFHDVKKYGRLKSLDRKNHHWNATEESDLHRWPLFRDLF